MGRVVTEATMDSLEDLWAFKRGLITADQVRSVSVSDALIDTGATLLSLPTRLILQLGLSRTALSEAGVYEAVRLTIQGRSCTMDVMEVPDNVPVLIGQLPLEHLDFVVDPRNRSLATPPTAANTCTNCTEIAAMPIGIYISGGVIRCVFVSPTRKRGEPARCTTLYKRLKSLAIAF